MEFRRVLFLSFQKLPVRNVQQSRHNGGPERGHDMSASWKTGIFRERRRRVDSDICTFRPACADSSVLGAVLTLAPALDPFASFPENLLHRLPLRTLVDQLVAVADRKSTSLNYSN